MRKYNVFVIDNKEIEKLCGEKLELSDGGFYSNTCKGPDYWSEIEAHVGMPIVSIRPSGREGWDEFLVVCADGYIKDGVPHISGNYEYIKSCLYDIFMEAENDECEVFDNYKFSTSIKDYENLIDWMIDEYDYQVDNNLKISDNSPSNPLSFLDAVKIAYNEGLFEIVYGDFITYGCSGIVCQENGENKNQFYFGGFEAEDFDGTPQEFVKATGKFEICKMISDTLLHMINDDRMANDVLGYMYDMKDCISKKYDGPLKAEIEKVLDEHINDTEKYIESYER